MALGYQQRDSEIVDYRQYSLTPGFSARGPAPRSMQQGQYFACVGAAQTFGCFCEDPYPHRSGLGLALRSLFAKVRFSAG